MGDPVVALVTRAVEASATIDEALAAIAEAVARFGLKRVSLRVYDAARDEVEVAGLWSDGPTLIEPGMRMRAAMTSFPELVAGDGPIVSDADKDPATVLDQLVRDEGIVSWISLPLRDRGTIAGILSLSSSSAHAFGPDDVSSLSAVAAAIEERLLALAAQTDPL